MKKIIGILLAGALVTSAFAVDFNAKVKMRGDVLGGTIDITPNDKKDANSFNALKLEKAIVDNNDFITTSFTGDKSGAAFNIKLDDRKMEIASAKVWIQPIDMLKITFGQQAWEAWSETTYTYGRMTAWGRAWANEGEETGFDILLTPMSGLEIDLGFKPGWDAYWYSAAAGVANVANWNIGAKVDLNPFVGLPIGVIANYKNTIIDWKSVDNTVVNKNASQITFGASYGNAWADGLYAHLVARIGFLNGFTKEGDINGGWGADTADKASMVIDNAIKYQAGAFKVWLSVPVLLDLVAEDDEGKDAKGNTVNKNKTALGFVLKASYGLGSVTPWVKLSQTDMGSGKFADFQFVPKIEAGADFNIGSCAMTVNLEATIPAFDKDKNEPAGNLSWRIPFAATMSF